MSAATAALLTAVAMASFSLVASVIMPDLVHGVMYDDRPAMVLRNIKILSQLMKKNEKFVYEFDYDKRPECHPPDGAGEITYKLWLKEDGKFERFMILEHATISYADPAQHHRITKIELPPLEPGRYMLQYRSKFQCKGASAVQEWEGPMMPFEVTL